MNYKRKAKKHRNFICATIEKCIQMIKITKNTDKNRKKDIQRKKKNHKIDELLPIEFGVITIINIYTKKNGIEWLKVGKKVNYSQLSIMIPHPATQ